MTPRIGYTKPPSTAGRVIRLVLPALAAVAALIAPAVAPAAVTTAPPAAANEAPHANDPRAIKIAEDVMTALGGKQNWDALTGLRWTFGAMVNDTVRSSRRHAWDKHTGWHKVEGKTAKGDAFVIVHKIGTTEGRAWMNGKPIEGDSLQKLIKLGERMWVNDTYWMLMPYKMLDPGVMLAYDSEKKVGDMSCDVISMTFDHVGQTPGDHYWVDVDQATHRVVRWEMVLQGDQPPPVAYTWEGWVQQGGLWFPTAHKKDKVNVFTNDVVAVSSFPPNEFTAP
jgi:hypothetical protein